jgi:hypothetical protein
MKKLKFLTLAAIAAATAMVSSCSDNGDLSTPTKEAEGKALVVNPTVDGSRITTTASGDFKSFKLFGFQNPPSKQPLFFNGTDGYVYNGAIGSAWSPTATGAKWPANSDTNSSNFYALSVNGGSSLPSYTGVDLTNIQQGKFSYTAPLSGSDVDLSKQEDILVASSLNALQTDNNGVLNLPFTHAFAKLTLQMRFNYQEGSNPTGDIKQGWAYTIKSITIHNVCLDGNYDYSSGWTPSNIGNITFTYAKPITIDARHTTSNSDLYQTLIDNASSIMIVPQSFTKWWVSDGVNGHTHTPLSTIPDAPYIEIVGFAWDKIQSTEALMSDFSWTEEQVNTFLDEHPLGSYDLNDETDEVYLGQTGYELAGSFSFLIVENGLNETLYPASVLFPFPSSLSFAPNKYYNIRLNIYKGYYDTGAYAVSEAGQS